MPRLSLAETKRLVQQVLASDDEDDDDFATLQPIFSTPTRPSIIQDRPVSESSVESKDGSKCEDPDVWERQAQRRAKLADPWLVQDVTDPSLLRWHRQGSVYCPCTIRRNHEEAQGLDVGFTKTKNLLIRYLGLRNEDTGLYAAVASNQLHPYADEDDDPHSWSATKMQRFTRHLQSRHPFVADPHPTMTLRVEVLAIEGMLDYVRRCHHNPESTTVHARPLDHGPNLATNRSHDTPLPKSHGKSNASSPSRTAVPTPMVSQEDPSVPEATATATDDNVTLPWRPLGDGPKPKIRAGDVIQYYPPHMHVSRNNLRTASVVGVYPRPSTIALFLSDGTHLPRDVQIKLVQQRKRHTLVPVPCPQFWDLSEFVLDKSDNDKYPDTWQPKGETGPASCTRIPRQTPEQGLFVPERTPSIETRNTSLADPGTSTTSMEEAKQNVPAWKQVLINLLEINEKEKQKRRCDRRKVAVREAHLRTAIQAQECLRSLSDSRNEDTSVVVEDIASSWSVSNDALWNFLTGDRKGFLTDTKVEEMTTRWLQWLPANSNNEKDITREKNADSLAKEKDSLLLAKAVKSELTSMKEASRRCAEPFDFTQPTSKRLRRRRH